VLELDRKWASGPLAEGRICAVKSEPMSGLTTMTGYIYDADGTRVAKGSISTLSCDLSTNGFQTQNDYILGLGGEQMTEMTMDTDGSMYVAHNNVWAGGKLLATYDGDGALHFYLTDPLGSRRVMTNYAGVVEQNCQNLPFGDGENCGPTPTEHLFTGKERDTESGNDYFPARYYASSMGRFLSPDPSGLFMADPENPQTLNLYSYVGNNPLRYTDPLGLSKDCGGGGDPSVVCMVTSAWDWLKDHLGGGGSSQNSGGESSPGSGYETEPDYNLSPGVNSQRFPGTRAGRDAAGIAAARQAIGPTSVPDFGNPACGKNGCKYEYGGLILRDRSGQYAFTDPVTFKQGGHFWSSHVMVPFGYKKAGSYHTHPGYRISGGMSLQDARSAEGQGYPEYMGEEYTGKVWKDDPSTHCSHEPCGSVIFDPNSQQH
jgi:RHS repeat-associated protein